MIETMIHIVWDETGAVAAHVDAGEAADLLESQSDGRFRRVLALNVTLPPAGPIEMGLTVSEHERPPVARKSSG
jgi:hypothetical protein